jgi:SM-20-related protein
VENKVGLAENFLNATLAAHLKANLLSLHLDEKLLTAGTGNNNKLTHDKLLRRDKIYWLDRKHEDLHENSFFDLMDEFVRFLNSTCYTRITGYEFHYALYEEGSFYKRHLDQFKNSKSRAYSMIMYLNEDWKHSDGGELCVYHPNHSQIITPVNGKCVFFKSSDLEHEVLLSHQRRMSITGWLKSD